MLEFGGGGATLLIWCMVGCAAAPTIVHFSSLSSSWHRLKLFEPFSTDKGFWCKILKNKNPPPRRNRASFSPLKILNNGYPLCLIHRPIKVKAPSPRPRPLLKNHFLEIRDPIGIGASTWCGKVLRLISTATSTTPSLTIQAWASRPKAWARSLVRN